MVFVGPSGCGKSTMLRMIAGLETLTGGSIHIGGQDVSAKGPSERGAAMVFQSYALYPHMTVEENMGFGLRMSGSSKTDTAKLVNETAQRLQLTPLLKRYPKQLSGGQRQRVAIARALAQDRPVLLLDEATSALDAQSEAAVADALSKAAQGRTTLIIAHRLATVRAANHILVMDQGRVVEEGTHDALIAQNGLYARLYQLQFKG